MYVIGMLAQEVSSCKEHDNCVYINGLLSHTHNHVEWLTNSKKMAAKASTVL